MTTRTIHRTEIPVCDMWVTRRLPGPILHVASRRHGIVEVWFRTNGQPYDVDLRVFGTGHELPAGDVRHVGTAIEPSGHLVWHLMQQGPARPVNAASGIASPFDEPSNPCAGCRCPQAWHVDGTGRCTGDFLCCPCPAFQPTTAPQGT